MRGKAGPWQEREHLAAGSCSQRPRSLQPRRALGQGTCKVPTGNVLVFWGHAGPGLVLS